MYTLILWDRHVVSYRSSVQKECNRHKDRQENTNNKNNKINKTNEVIIKMKSSVHVYIR